MYAPCTLCFPCVASTLVSVCILWYSNKICDVDETARPSGRLLPNYGWFAWYTILAVGIFFSKDCLFPSTKVTTRFPFINSYALITEVQLILLYPEVLIIFNPPGAVFGVLTGVLREKYLILNRQLSLQLCTIGPGTTRRLGLLLGRKYKAMLMAVCHWLAVSDTYTQCCLYPYLPGSLFSVITFQLNNAHEGASTQDMNDMHQKCETATCVTWCILTVWTNTSSLNIISLLTQVLRVEA